jgi:hypothetical protein
MSTNDIKILQQEIERLEQIVSRHEQSASGVPQLPLIDELPMWFDVLSDLAVMASCERMPRMGNLLWSIEKLSEKFADDARKIVSAQIATGVDHE